MYYVRAPCMASLLDLPHRPCRARSKHAVGFSNESHTPLKCAAIAQKHYANKESRFSAVSARSNQIRRVLYINEGVYNAKNTMLSGIRNARSSRQGGGGRGMGGVS